MTSLVKTITTRIAEKKYSLAVSGGPQAIDQLWDITCVTQISQGAADTSRVGDEIRVSSIEYKYTMFSVNNEPAAIRFVIVQWHPQVTDTNGSPPSVAGNIFFDGTVDSENYLQPIYHDNRRQFRILYDKTHKLSAADEITATYHGFITRGFQRNLQYYGGSATNAANQIFILKCSSVTGANSPTMTNFIKVNYTDS